MSGRQVGVVVVGGAAAGLATVQTLRREGFEGSISVVAEEAGPPYDRPPLSKQVMLGTWAGERTHLMPEPAITALDVTWLAGRRAVDLRPRDRRVVLDDGEELAYTALVAATGLRPRRSPTLTPTGLGGVHVLRTLDDALALRAELADATSVAIIGAGFIGAELASTARALDRPVSLFDPLPHPLGNVAAGPMAKFMTKLHRDNGVELYLGEAVAGVASRDGARVSGVVLADGREIAADVVIASLGSIPTTDWLERSGLDLMNGLVCDASLEAAPGVYGVGDVARTYRNTFQQHLRIEHRLNAAQQGLHVGRNIAHGTRDPFDEVPYFWSDQFGARVQGYGLPQANDAVALIAGDVADGRFVLAHGRRGRVVAVVGVGLPRDVRQASHLVADRTDWREVDGLTSE